VKSEVQQGGVVGTGYANLDFLHSLLNPRSGDKRLSYDSRINFLASGFTKSH